MDANTGNNFVPFELAVKMRELGFENKFCLAVYGSDGVIKICIGTMRIEQMHPYVIAPLWQQAFDWFLHEHRYWSFIEFDNEENYFRYVLGFAMEDCFHGEKTSYENARKACLEKLVELLKMKHP